MSEDSKVYIYTYTSPDYYENNNYLIKELNFYHKLTDYERDKLFPNKKRNILLSKLIKFYNWLKGKLR